MATVILQMEMICYSYIAPVICSLGILTNILNLTVLSRPQMKGSAYSFLTALAFTDMGTLVIFFMFIQVSSKAGSFGDSAYWWTLFNVYIVNPGLNFCCSASVWIISLITIDRYLSVRWPLLAKVFCCRKYARRKLVVAFLLALAFNSLRLCQYTVMSTFVNDTRITIVKPTPLRSTYHFSIFLWVYAVMVMYIPTCLLLAMNSYLLIHLRRAGTQRRQMIAGGQAWTSRPSLPTKREDSRLTATLIAVTFMFIICIMPSSFSEPSIAYAIFGAGRLPLDFFQITSYQASVIIANMLVLCNSSLNFFLYCAFNEKFSRTMRQIIQDLIKKLSGMIERENSQTSHILARIQLSHNS